MVNNWLKYTLDDVVEMKSEKVSSDVVDINNYISTENMLPDKEGVKTASGIPEQDKYLGFIEGDVLFSNIRTYFRKIWRAKFNGGASNDIIVFSTRNKNILDQTYLYYLLSNEDFIEYTVRTAKGTKMPRGDKSAIKAFKFVLPSSITDQKSIAHILSTLDDKIELTRQMNQTLEQMAQALYKSWFVDFDPVIDNALAAGNDIPEPFQKRAEGRSELGGNRKLLPKYIQELFPDKFEFSEKLEKWVPKDWNVGRLDDVLIFQRGFDLPKTKRTPGQYPLIAASGKDGTHNEAMVKGPGVTTGRSGRLGIVTFIRDDFWPLNTTLWVKELKKTTAYHAYYFLKEVDLEIYNAGSAVPTLNRNHIHNMTVVIPTMDIIDQFTSEVKALYDKKYQNDLLSKALESLRNTLLPKLLSGELKLLN
jgi:type I restriction enzyme S subunit